MNINFRWFSSFKLPWIRGPEGEVLDEVTFHPAYHRLGRVLEPCGPKAWAFRLGYQAPHAKLWDCGLTYMFDLAEHSMLMNMEVESRYLAWRLFRVEFPVLRFRQACPTQARKLA